LFSFDSLFWLRLGELDGGEGALIAGDAQRTDKLLVAGDFEEAVELAKPAVTESLGGEEIAVGQYLAPAHEAERIAPLDVGAVPAFCISMQSVPPRPGGRLR
jgi:hypothetical protein